MFAALPPAPDDPKAAAAYPKYDAKQKRLSLPLMGGPSMTPTVALYGDGLLVSTSSAVADKLLAEKPAAAAIPSPGNLYVRLRPLPCVQAIAGAAELFVEMNTLKGFTPETFKQEVQKWTDKAKAVDDISALLSVDRGEVLGELTVTTRISDTVAGGKGK
jgi:hypothetical protein